MEVANSNEHFEFNQESDVDDDKKDHSDLKVRNTAVSRELLSASFSTCKQQSYTREKKLWIVQFYYENNNNYPVHTLLFKPVTNQFCSKAVRKWINYFRVHRLTRKRVTSKTKSRLVT